MRDSPCASAASSAYRCDIDLSPGTVSRPWMRRAGWIVTAVSGSMRGSYAEKTLFCVSRLDILRQMEWYSFPSMTPTNQQVRVEFTSAFEMLDFVQVVSDHVGRSVG